MSKTAVAQKIKATNTLPSSQGILQRKCACGNQTIAGGECAECGNNKHGMQRKLTIGASNDPLEREADRVADQVMAMPMHSAVNSAPLQIQRYAGQASKKAGIAPESVDRVLASSGRPLESALRQDMEQRFGHDFSQVRVHSGAAAEQSARDVSANAYTVGNNIVFGTGEFAPRTHEGQRLIAHELTHVIQQRNNLPVIQNQNNETNLIQRQITTFVEGEIQGHASPRWEHTKRANREELNLQLSRDRADAVEYLFREMFQRAMNGSMNVEFVITSSSENHRDPSTVSIPSEGIGDRQTIIEAAGNTDANDQAMRRVDISIVITQQVDGEAGYSEAVIIPEECEPYATNQWSIKMSISGGGGHAGLGGAVAFGELKNRRTGQIAQGNFIGGGIGVGGQTPGVDPGWGEWTDFISEDISTFTDYDGTLARLTSAGAGIGLIGYSATWISFPMRGANSIYVGDFNMGAMSADAGSNVGVWNIIGIPPGPRCHPEETIERHGSSAYQFDIQDDLRHTVYFETGEAEIQDNQFQLLNEFVQYITARRLE